jgi:3,4-dihydroxy 2-butanone 4-phosphate synthase/GTP cyclohydrolase II
VIVQQPESSSTLLRRLRQLDSQQEREVASPRRGREEMRMVGLGSQILADVGVGKMRVLGHAMKAPAMSGFDLEIVEYIEDVNSPDHHEIKATR